MKAKEYPLMEQCVEIGVTRGIARAFKYNDKPDRDAIEASCVREVMNEISEWFDFSDEGGDRGAGRFWRVGGTPTAGDL